jgi:cystathionine beta-lyase
MMVLAFTKPGDKIIVQPPVYFPFFSAVKAHKRVLVYNQLIEENGDYSIDIEGLKKKIDNKTRMLLLCHPHNPVGRVWREQELLELAEVCLDRNILMVSDEVHSDLVFPHQKHTPLATISKEISDNTITCMAPSKTFNTAGMATSYLIIENPQLLKRYNEILDNLHIGMGNIFGTVALEAAYRYGRPWLNQMLDYVWGNVLFVESFLKDRIPAIRMVKPEATYLLWLDCRNLKLKGKALTEFMISKVGLGLNDGASFGPGGEGFQRMNVACPRSQVETALERLEAAVKKLKI